MTARQIEIGSKILKLFAENEGQFFDNKLILELSTQGYSNEEIKSIYIILIDDYNLIRRNISSKELKHLTDKGFDAANSGLKKYLRNRKVNEFINGYTFKIIQFLIPTIIAIIALVISCNKI